MKWILTTSLCCLAVLVSPLVKAQESDTTRATETILKVENPYKKGKTKWLNNNGFNTSTYGWDDPVINLNVEKAVKRRSTGNIVGLTGGTILVLGLLGNAVGSFVNAVGDGGGEYQVVKGPYYLGGIMVATSVALSFDSLSKLNKAKRAREARYAK